MSKHKKNKRYQRQILTPGTMQVKNSDSICPEPIQISEKTDDGDWVPVMNFKIDKDAMCRRLEKGIPPLLAMVLPPDMEISAVGNRGNEPMYIVRKVVVCGTVEDIIHHLAAQQNTTN